MMSTQNVAGKRAATRRFEMRRQVYVVAVDALDAARGGVEVWRGGGAEGGRGAGFVEAGSCVDVRAGRWLRRAENADATIKRAIFCALRTARERFDELLERDGDDADAPLRAALRAAPPVDARDVRSPRGYAF